ncbi:DISARM system phospholipase D-like protein DrmC [Stieleria sp. TO1_6]|uniref:DISARM system phospholipase D-like protein DrmC n=1 Tax=Stieleria tagensis TaxID=2956795 RepID=UPI00209B39EF|nr:DISARM system phospholipase D-like protein DrmC [Stieleria tagensis]MCO8123323.1 DISARM system phospholipase D-like protein DrmC [Stieleria tagensis]
MGIQNTSSDFVRLSDSDLRSLAMGLESGRISVPCSALQIRRLISGPFVDDVVSGINRLAEESFNGNQVAACLNMISMDRLGNSGGLKPQIDLVTSGPEAPGLTNRDTAVVVRELFTHAMKSVVVVGYAIYQGQMVFQALAKRMDEIPDLDVEFFLNIARPDRDTTQSEIIVSRFVERFKTTQWPKSGRLPKVHYDPRSVADDSRIRSSLHAKCVIVDNAHVFISSANFTEAGQQRNIEVGLHLNSSHLATKTSLHFRKMLEAGLFKRAL